MNVEKNTNPISWLHGLQDYLEFVKDDRSKQYVDFLLSLLYSNNGPITINDNLDMKEFIHHLRKYADNPILDVFHKYFRMEKDPVALQDAYSRGQVNSKIWLVQELIKIQNTFNMIHVHAGWYGQLRYYLDAVNVEYGKMRIFETDSIAAEVSDYVFNLDLIEDYRIKSAEVRLPLRDDPEEEQNMPWVTRTGIEYEVHNYNKGTSYKEKTQPDLIINSSAEHMSSVWYHKMINRPMETDPLFVIQTNNLFDVPEHQLCVHSLDHMQKKFPMSRLEYAGEKELFGYKRFMMIGRP